MTQEKDDRPGNGKKSGPRSRVCQVCGRHPVKSKMMPAALVRSVVADRIRKIVPNWTDDGYICIDDLNRFRAEFERERSVGERLADQIAEFGGSWRFIIIFGLVLFFWVGINSAVLLWKPFDPFTVFLSSELSVPIQRNAGILSC